MQRHAFYRHTSHECASLVGFSSGPLSWTSLAGLSRGHASVSAPKACVLRLRLRACVLCLRPRAYVPYLRPLPLPLSLPQSLGALSAHFLSRATTAVLAGRSRGGLAEVEMCR